MSNYVTSIKLYTALNRITLETKPLLPILKDLFMYANWDSAKEALNYFFPIHYLTTVSPQSSVSDRNVGFGTFIGIEKIRDYVKRMMYNCTDKNCLLLIECLNAL